jgi:hypothetical protein
MKIIPILAVTNALALGLAVYLYVQLDQVRSQTGAGRSDTASARLAARVDTLERDLAMKGVELVPAAPAPEAVSRTDSSGAAMEPKEHDGKAPPALAANAPEETQDATTGAGAEENYDPREMEVFRHKVKKALEINAEEDQKNRIIDGIDDLVKQNKIAPLNTKQKEGVAATVIAYRQKIPLVFTKLRESGALDNASREDRGRIVRSEFDTLRAEAQQSLEQYMPAADAKTYLDESMRDGMRGGFGGFGGGPGAPTPPNRTR